MQLYVLLPVLPLVTPLIMHSLNAYGVSRILALYDTLLDEGYYKDTRVSPDLDATEDDDSEHEGDRIAPRKKGPPDVETSFSVAWPRIARYYGDVWRAQAFSTLPRSASLLWDLSAVTVGTWARALCG